MRIWGYLLIILNLAAAGAFVYFATSLWNKRSEWQFALFKQELANGGLPLEESDAPDDLNSDSVPFGYDAGPNKITQIKKDRLKKLIPTGGEVLGDMAGPVTNQTEEVKRVEKLVFAQLDAVKDPSVKRLRQLILLLNLSRAWTKDSPREGAYALLRDLPVPVRYLRARHEIAYLGRSAPQVTALTALAAVADVHTGFVFTVPPEDQLNRNRAGRKALAAWAAAEVPNAVPALLPPAHGPPPAADDPAVKKNKDDRDRLHAAVELFRAEVGRDVPDKVKVDEARKRVTDLLDGDAALTGAEAKLLIPAIVEIGGNLLSTPEDVAAAKAKLIELMHSRSTTEAEKKALTALADLMIPPKLELPMNAPQDQVVKARSDQFIRDIDVAATESLRAYFEEAAAPSAATDKGKKLPADWSQARSQLAGVKVVRSPIEKKLDVAHLLYHLDAHLGGDKPVRDVWYMNLVRAPGPGETEYKLPDADEALLKNRTAWHQRVAAVVGLENYAAAAEAQATRLNKLAQHLRTRIIEEQGVFESEYQIVVGRTLYLALQQGLRAAEVKEQEALRDEHRRQIMTRLAEQKVLEDELTKVTAAAKKATDDLALKVNELFQITKQLGEAQDALVGLEIQLRDLELPKKKK